MRNLIPDSNLKFEPNHGLENNWKVAVAAAKNLDWFPKDDQIELIAVTIRDFSEIDPRGVIFRYPDSVKGEQHLKEWSLINLGIIRKRADAVFEIFVRWNSEIDALIHP